MKEHFNMLETFPQLPFFVADIPEDPDLPPTFNHSPPLLLVLLQLFSSHSLSNLNFGGFILQAPTGMSKIAHMAY